MIPYQITIEGDLDDKWQQWFGGMEIVPEPGCEGLSHTRLVGYVADQSALHGLLARIRDLNLTIISVTRLDQEDVTPEFGPN